MNMQTLFQEYRKRTKLNEWYRLLMIISSLILFFFIAPIVTNPLMNKVKDIEIEYQKEESISNTLPENIRLNELYSQFKKMRINNLEPYNPYKINQDFENAIILDKELVKKYHKMTEERKDLSKTYLVKLMISIIPYLLAYFFLFHICLYVSELLTEKMLKPKGNIKRKIIEQKYNGSLYDIFDKNCPATAIVLKDNNMYLENELLSKQSISGETLIMIENMILEEKKVIEEENAIKERKEALINSNTQSGIMLREIESLKTQN